MPGGRPTDYKPEYCEQMILLFKQGWSIAEVCLEFDICKKTFYNWEKEYHEFLHSKEKGVFFSEGWFMKQGRENLKNKDFNSTLWYMQMKNRFGWKDKQETDITSGGEKIGISTIQWVDGKDS